MKTIRYALVALLCIAFICREAKAQLPSVDITLVPLMNGQYEVRVRPDLNFDGLFSSLVFSLRWEGTSSATFSFDETQDLSDIGMSVNPSGGVATSGANKYRIYTGFGGAPFSASGIAWVAGEEFVLGQFTVTNGPVDVHIVEDDWTQANNGNFFVSLNGINRTGGIYEGVAAVRVITQGQRALVIMPNPATGMAVLSLEVEGLSKAFVEVIDATGRICLTESFAAVAGRNTHHLDATKFASGTYQVRVSSLGTQWSTAWVIQHP